MESSATLKLNHIIDYLWLLLSRLPFQIVSTFTKGEQMIPVLNKVGTHCAVLGNHDFGMLMENAVCVCVWVYIFHISFPLFIIIFLSSTQRPRNQISIWTVINSLSSLFRSRSWGDNRAHCENRIPMANVECDWLVKPDFLYFFQTRQQLRQLRQCSIK